MKKNIFARYLILSAMIIFILTINASAMSEKDIWDYAKADELFDKLPEEMNIKDARDLINSGNINDIESNFLNALLEKTKESFGNNIAFFSGLIAIFLIGALMGNINSSFGSDDYKNSFDLLYLGITAIYCYAYISSSVDYTLNVMSKTNDIMLSSMPVLTLLWGLGGNAVAAVKNGAVMSFSIQIFETLNAKVLGVLTKILLLFSFASVYADKWISRLSDFIKKTVKISCVFIFTALSATLFFSSAISSAKDSLSLRAVRFAAGNFIPVVGNLVGEASKTLLTSVQYLRTKCGVLLLFILLFALIPPIISLFIKRLFLIFASNCAGILGESKAEKLLRELCGIFDLLIAISISSAVYFIFYIVLFIKTRAVGS